MTDNPRNVPAGTIDITNLVAALKSVWIEFATKLVIQAASSTPYTFWLKWPVIGSFFSLLVKLGVSAIANSIENEAFFLNTALRKAAQANDFLNAVNAKNNLPPTASDKEFENAEKAQMDAFRNFVMVSN